MSDETSGRNKLKAGELVFVCLVGCFLFAWWMQRGFPIPFRRYDQAAYRSCITCLKQIDGAAQQWGLENGKGTNDSYSFSDPTYLAFLKGSVLPKCPQGGRYTAGTNIADVPKCNIPGHTL